ncbi:MAG: DUF4087 domain-containing protein [Paracoccaceae bacterium]
MRSVVCAMIVVTVAGAAHAERRCGWYHNPTPANVFLEDADGQWWISTQGSAPAPGFEDAYTRAFDDRVRIDYAGQVTNRYGYSCACVDGVFDAGNAVSVSRLKELPLSQCENDPALPGIEHYGQ